MMCQPIIKRFWRKTFNVVGCSTGVMIVAHQSFVDYGDGHHHGSSDTNPTANVELCGNDP